jgi:MarR family transcriptional regulator, organic hydroperoxide resistance regulator
VQDSRVRFAHASAQILRDYPRIYFACHRRHTRDPVSGDLVSLKHVQILDHLDEVNSLTLGDLADHLGVTPSTTSIAIDQRVKRGYVSRTPDVVDRRRVHLRLTAAGARVCAAHSVLDPVLVDQMIAAVPDADRQRALDGLALLARAAVEATGGRHRDRSADQSHAG